MRTRRRNTRRTRPRRPLSTFQLHNQRTCLPQSLLVYWKLCRLRNSSTLSARYSAGTCQPHRRCRLCCLPRDGRSLHCTDSRLPSPSPRASARSGHNLSTHSLRCYQFRYCTCQRRTARTASSRQRPGTCQVRNPSNRLQVRLHPPAGTYPRRIAGRQLHCVRLRLAETYRGGTNCRCIPRCTGQDRLLHTLLKSTDTQVAHANSPVLLHCH